MNCRCCEPLKNALSGKYRAAWLMLLTALAQGMHALLYPFPKRDALSYLHILHEWNSCNSYAQILEKFPKFGLLLFPFLPLKWLEKAGVPLYPASIVYMMAMSCVSVWAFHKIVLMLTGDEKKATCCGVLLAVHPMLLLYAGNLMRDTPYLMFCLLLVLCFIYAVRQKRFVFFLLTGVTLGMCLLSRFESWELLVLFPAGVLFYAWQKKFRWKEFLAWVLGAAAGFAGICLLMLMAVDDFPLLYEKGKIMFFSFFPKWMGV